LPGGFCQRSTYLWGSAARQGRLFNLSQIGGDGGSCFGCGGIMLLTQEGLQIDPTVKGGHVLRQFVTLLAFGRVQRLSLVYVFLCSNRACDTQSQRRHHEPDTTIRHRLCPKTPVSQNLRFAQPTAASRRRALAKNWAMSDKGTAVKLYGRYENQ
jgi:hypothetical protein